MSEPRHLTTSELQAGMAHVEQSPRERGTLELIVRRPEVDRREVLQQGELDLRDGLRGDTWNQRGSSRMPDGSPHPDMQITLMNARLIALIAGERENWPLAGDQLYVDLDLGLENLPPGTRLAIGGAVLQVTDQPHTGCAKFMARFGRDALAFINAPERKSLHLRGINTRVVQPGPIHAGDAVIRLPAA